MCFSAAIPFVVAGLTALGSIVSDSLSIKAQNEAAMSNYSNELARQKLVNQNALAQYSETTSRLNINRQRQGQNAFEQAQLQIAENQKRMATARASAGSSGLMGLPLNVLDTSFQAAIGGISSNLQQVYTEGLQNMFFDQNNARLQAMSTMNQAVPNAPYLQRFGWGNLAKAGISGALGFFSAKGTGGASGGQTTDYGLSGTPGGFPSSPDNPGGWAIPDEAAAGG